MIWSGNGSLDLDYMILRNKKLVFIHIPKCAGTTVEKFFGGENIKTHETNYDLALGWCPNRRIHMQHATPDQMINHSLLTKEEWNDFHSIAVVRNPFEKMTSE